MMVKRFNLDFDELLDFLQIETPKAWFVKAQSHLPLILLDHAHCERKAAATAITFLSKYPERTELVHIMSPLAREELLHFEKVIALMKKRGIDYEPLPPSAYASTLHKHITPQDGDERLCDKLIIGALIEARSCERFYGLIPYLQDEELTQFYNSLIKSEARHFKEYLMLAHRYGQNIEQRLAKFLRIENELIGSKDSVLRFHSGIPD